MPDPTIVEYLVQDSSSQTLAAIEAAHKRVYLQLDRNEEHARYLAKGFEKLVEDTAAANGWLDKFNGTGQSSQQMQQQATRSMGSLRDMTQGFASGLMISESALSQFGNTAGKSASGIDLARTAMMSLGIILMNPTPLGIAAMGIGTIVGMLDQQRKAAELAQKPAKDLIQSIDNLGGANTTLGKQMQDVFDVSGKVADKWANLATKSDTAATAIRNQAKAQLELNEAQQKSGTFADTSQFGPGRATFGAGFGTGRTRFTNERDIESVRNQAFGTNQFNTRTNQAADAQEAMDRALQDAPKIQAIWDGWKKADGELAQSHKKRMDSFISDETQAYNHASEAHVQAEENAKKQIYQIGQELARSLRELDYSRGIQLREADYNRSLQVQAQARQQMLSDRDDARARVQIAEDSARRIAELGRNYQKQGLTAKTYSQYLALQQEYRDQVKAVQDEAKLRAQEIEQRKQDRDEERAYQRGLQEEAARHQGQLATESYEHQRNLMIESAERQKQAVRDATEEQTTAIGKALQTQLDAIETRRKEEIQAYGDAAKKARDTRDEQIKAITDTTSEVDKQIAAMRTLGTLTDAQVTKFHNAYVEAENIRNSLLGTSQINFGPGSAYIAGLIEAYDRGLIP